MTTANNLNSAQLYALASAIDARLTQNVNELFTRGRMNVQKYMKTLLAISNRNFACRFDERGHVGYHVWA